MSRGRESLCLPTDDCVSLSMIFVCSKRFMMQANSSDDRKAWLEVMEGKEPVYTSLKVLEGNDQFEFELWA